MVDARLPDALLDLVLKSYLHYYRALTSAVAIELYATEKQEMALDRLGCRSRLVAYHVPWQKRTHNLARLLATSHPRPITATVHAYEWADHIHWLKKGRWLSETPGALNSFITRTKPTEIELTLLEQAAKNQLTILFETVVARELYAPLFAANKSLEAYLFHRLDAVRRLRDAWLARHGGSEAKVPVGTVLNPWHAAIEMRGSQIKQWLREGLSTNEIRGKLMSLLRSFYHATENTVRRFYVGNSRTWELNLPEALQRGHFFDSKGIIPEFDLLRQVLRDQPELSGAITLEAAPQAALLSGLLDCK